MMMRSMYIGGLVFCCLNRTSSTTPQELRFTELPVLLFYTESECTYVYIYIYVLWYYSQQLLQSMTSSFFIHFQPWREQRAGIFLSLILVGNNISFLSLEILVRWSFCHSSKKNYLFFPMILTWKFFGRNFPKFFFDLTRKIFWSKIS